jgi:hypothetical protein
MAGMELLGRVHDLSVGFIPVDMQTAANTGKRVALKKASSLSVVLFKAVGTAGDDPVLTLKQHTASSGGTTSNLAAITNYYYKSAVSAALAGTETWVKVTQAASATVTDPGGLGFSAESSMIVVIPVSGASLADGYAYVSLDVADVGGNAQLGGVLYILGDLDVQRAPANLQAALA